MAVFKAHHFLCFPILFQALLRPTSAVYCYFPNGTQIPIPTGAPPDLSTGCPITAANASHSMCSAWQHPQSPVLNGVSGVKCRPDGLVSDESGDSIYRTSCTDPTWKDPGCIKLCMNGTPASNGDVLITPCDDGSYCCGANGVAKSCCTNHHGVFIKDGQETSVNPNATPNSGTSSSSGPSGSTSSDSGSGKSDNSQVNIGAVVGGIVGGVAVLLAVVGVGLYLLFRKRRRTNTEARVRDPNRPPDYEWVSMAEVDATNTQKVEMPGQSVMRPELGEAKPSPVEMDVMPR